MDGSVRDRERGQRLVKDDIERESLLTPSEAEMVLTRKENRGLILVTGEKPLLVKRINYFQDAVFQRLWVRD